ncbi:hypothetical protein P6144_15835 [Sphingomonas sp. HITSZ_GF]|uniref:hypothetical protein n=1 Tax=Sphingomonas sp. HITSZ_GF TaxID=3037247 RepID=UPI00240DCBAC|nr:hypothetical protein [Sphingomonas sp. HITSZ_GF]MDG2535131.1 hypothetical protein [Sphingomonas sp. HITSZ_GF]
MTPGDAILLLLMWGVAAFVANRLYVILRHREINVRGAVYSRADTPALYWAQLLLVVVALMLVGGIALAMTLGAVLA